MSKKTPGIKIPYFRANQYPLVDGLRCVSVLVPDDDAFMPLLAGLVKLAGRAFNYEGDDAQRYALAEKWRAAYDATDWEGCMNCCDEILAALAAQQALLEEIKQGQVDNATSERELPQSTIENEICGGATAVVQAMQANIVKTYAESEAGLVDNVFEAIPLFLEAIPILGELPFDELFELVNWYFENQVVDEAADYLTLESQLICDLKCFVQANGNEFDWDVWSDWLVYVAETYPTNRAAQIFGRYAPVRLTWINQIAALINRDGSLQAFFDTLAVAWQGGLLNPTVCADCECAPEFITLFNPDTGLTEEYDLGVEYEIESFDASGDNRIFLTAEGCFNVEVIASAGYNPSPFLQPSNFWYATAPCDDDDLTFHFASGTGSENPVDIDTSPGVSQFVLSNAGLGAFSITVIFTVP